MELRPNNIAELSHLLACAHKQSQRVTAVDLSRLERVLQHIPEDMTVTVDGGMSLEALSTELAKRGQWLPIDFPSNGNVTVERLLSENFNGPRRLGYGTVRDYLIGLKVALADGRIIEAGGKVVKNVAGYDLPKLFIGSRGSLGVIVEATFKLRPICEVEIFLQRSFPSVEKAESTINAVIESELMPHVLDLHQVDRDVTVVVGFAGTREEVTWQSAKVTALGITEVSSLDYDSQFRLGISPVETLPVLPSKLFEALAQVKSPFVARAGNGVIYRHGTARITIDPKILLLMQRVKKEFDPHNVLPEIKT